MNKEFQTWGSRRNKLHRYRRPFVRATASLATAAEPSTIPIERRGYRWPAYSINSNDLPPDLAAIYERFAGDYGPFRNQVAVFAHVPAAFGT